MTNRPARDAVTARIAAIAARLDGAAPAPPPPPPPKPAPVPAWRSTAPTIEERDREEQAVLDKLRRLHRPR